MHILHTAERSTILCKPCAHIAHWREKHNLVHILRIDKRKVLTCINIAHEISLRNYCASNVQLAHLAHNTISCVIYEGVTIQQNNYFLSLLYTVTKLFQLEQLLSKKLLLSPNGVTEMLISKTCSFIVSLQF